MTGYSTQTTAPFSMAGNFARESAVVNVPVDLFAVGREREDGNRCVAASGGEGDRHIPRRSLLGVFLGFQSVEVCQKDRNLAVHAGDLGGEEWPGFDLDRRMETGNFQDLADEGFPELVERGLLRCAGRLPD